MLAKCYEKIENYLSFSETGVLFPGVATGSHRAQFYPDTNGSR